MSIIFLSFLIDWPIRKCERSLDAQRLHVKIWVTQASLVTMSDGQALGDREVGSFLLPTKVNQNFLELILKLEIALSNVENSGYSRGFRTGSKYYPRSISKN